MKVILPPGRNRTQFRSRGENMMTVAYSKDIPALAVRQVLHAVALRGTAPYCAIMTSNTASSYLISRHENSSG